MSCDGSAFPAAIVGLSERTPFENYRYRVQIVDMQGQFLSIGRRVSCACSRYAGGTNARKRRGLSTRILRMVSSGTPA